jgi:hypothetical protein
VSFGARSGNWKVRVTLLPFESVRTFRQEVRKSGWQYLALLTIRDVHSIYTLIHRKHEPDREQHGSAEAARQVRHPVRKDVGPARPVTKHPGHRHHQNRQAHHQNLRWKVPRARPITLVFPILTVFVNRSSLGGWSHAQPLSQLIHPD